MERGMAKTANRKTGETGKGKNEKAPENYRGFELGDRETTSRPSRSSCFNPQALAGAADFAAAARRAFLIMACIVLVGSAPLLSQ